MAKLTCAKVGLRMRIKNTWATIKVVEPTKLYAAVPMDCAKLGPNKAPEETVVTVIETTAPLSPPSERSTVSYKVKSSSFTNNRKEHRGKRLNINEKGQNLDWEIARLWNLCRGALADLTGKPQAKGFLHPVN